MDVLEEVTSQLSEATSTQNEQISSTEENILTLDQRESNMEMDVDGLDDRVRCWNREVEMGQSEVHKICSSYAIIS